MVYRPRAVNKSAACYDSWDWLEVFARGKKPRPDPDFGRPQDHPPPDVYDLVMQRELSELRWRLESLCMALQKPVVQNGTNGQSCSNLRIGETLRNFSAIWEFLTAITWADGTKRVPGSLSLKLASGRIQGTLTLSDLGLYLSRSGESVDDVFLALEMALAEGEPGWRASSFSKGKK